MLIDPSRILILQSRMTQMKKEMNLTFQKDLQEDNTPDQNKNNSFKEQKNSPSWIANFSIRCQQKLNFQIEASTRNFPIFMDEPIRSGGDDCAPTPVEVLLTAIAGCMEMNWLYYSTISHISLKNVEMQVEAILDRQLVFNASIDQPARLQSIIIRSLITSHESPEKLQFVHELVRKYCIVSGSLDPNIQKEYLFEIQAEN
jgi:uncharacterized OsmC-like protein